MALAKTEKSRGRIRLKKEKIQIILKMFEFNTKTSTYRQQAYGKLSLILHQLPSLNQNNHKVLSIRSPKLVL